MATTRQIEKKLAIRIEAGKDVGGSPPHNGWGDSSARQTLGANNAIAGLLTIKRDNKTEQSASIEGQGFDDIPVHVGKNTNGSFERELSYTAIDKVLYLCFGWERPGYSPLTNAQFTVSGVTITPTAGATYTNNGSTFTVRGANITGGAGTIYTSRTSGSNAPESSGILTKASGTGDATITFSATSGIYYSHLFELDARDRHYTAYRSTPDEQTAGDYNAGDRKCRMATIGSVLGTNDFVYRNCMVKKISISSSAGNIGKMSFDFVSYDELRGDYSSGTWTFATNQAGTAYLIPHHQWNCRYGTPGNLSDIAITDFNVDIDIPLDELMDSESGLFLSEPMFSGKYQVTANITVSRHTVDTYFVDRDSYTGLCLDLTATFGSYQFKILIQDMRIEKANLSEEGVPKIPINIIVGPKTNAGTPFTFELEGHTVIQTSPVLVIVNNQNSINEMQRE